MMHSLQNTTCAGFPKWGQVVGEQFGQNGKKLHENDKISIFGAKQCRDMGGQTNFLGSVGDRPSPLTLGKTLRVAKIIQSTKRVWKKTML